VIQETIEPAEAILTIPADQLKVEIKNLDFFYGKTQALFGVSMGIAEKKVTALIGPSGCGKSTLLRVINRMYALYPGHRAEGTIMMDGQDILGRGVSLNALRAKVGMVFQKPTPFPMSIYDNVAYGVRLYERLSKADMDVRVEESLNAATLWGEVKDKLKTSGLGLSGGQQQRLCVARAVAVKPEVLLLDEPASALDPVSTAKLEDTIAGLKQKYTIVIVTHNLGQAARIQLFTNPTTERARDYVTGRFG